MTEEEEWRAQVGARLKRARVARGYTEKQVGDELGCTPQQVSAIEVGKSEVKGSRLRRLCILFGEPSDFFLFGFRTVPIEQHVATGCPSCQKAPAGMVGEILGRIGVAGPAR